MSVAKFVAILSVIAVLVSVAGRPAAGSQKPAMIPKYDWLFRFLDRNRNGKIDVSDRKKMPSPMRQWLGSNGIADRDSISRERFLKIAPRMMQALRSRKSIPASRFLRSSLVDGFPDHSKRLPAKYRRRDVDADGQIGFYEWDLYNAKAFRALDLNRDGFLTPHELGYDSSKSAAKRRTSFNTTRQAYSGRAKIGFRLADTNRDGLVSAEEWEKIRPGSLGDGSSRSAPRFPMSLEDFSRYYLQHSASTQK